MSKFSRNDYQWLWSKCPKKFKLLKYQHIIYHFKARDLEILSIKIFSRKYEQNKFRETLGVHKIAKFKYFAKIITYPDYVLQKLYIICSYFKSLNFFGHSLRSHWGVISRTFAHKFAKSKYF